MKSTPQTSGLWLTDAAGEEKRVWDGKVVQSVRAVCCRRLGRLPACGFLARVIPPGVGSAVQLCPVFPVVLVAKRCLSYSYSYCTRTRVRPLGYLQSLVLLHALIGKLAEMQHPTYR